MKRTRRTVTIVTALLAVISSSTRAQSGFSPGAYMQFLENHRNYAAGDLLEDHPAKTVYYSGRQYPADLKEIAWFDTLDSRFRFTGYEKELLGQNHFMVSERLGYNNWASAFIALYSSDLPLFLSSDFILSTLHNSYDAILQTLEWQFLEPNLQELLEALYNHVPALVGKYGEDDRFHEALGDVDLYISVARTLAEDAEFPPRYGSRDFYDRVVSAIDAEQLANLPLFTSGRERRLDFSQFKPRGHYNKDIYTPDGIRTLENYFRAMMWLGRIDFLLTAPPENPWETGWTDEELRRMQLGALLLNESLYGCGKIGNLQKHEEIISFLVGPDDNMTPGELKELEDALLKDPAGLFDDATFESFMAALNASDDYGQKIMSNFFLVDPFSEDPGSLPVSYKLLGQKFLIDSYVFSEVVFDRIVYNGEKVWRPLPDPLDVMAALGNEDALALLEPQLDSFKYAANMAGLKYLIEAYDAAFWEQSLYNTWLGGIRSLNPPSSPSGLPYFMQTTAWHQEKLNTQLTSWAQLRHDNILYGKQSYTGGTGCSYPYTYVEPYPGLYRLLKVFARNAYAFFGEVLTSAELESKDRIREYYRQYGTIMESLEGIAQKELDGIRLNDGEVAFLKTMINRYMVSGPSISGWYADLFFDLQKGLMMDFTVADVHTQPTEKGGAVVGNVLHAGNGLINMGVFIAGNPCNPGQQLAFAGPVSSFHRKVTSGFKRLTDQEWETLFYNGAVPERPDWVAGYLADGEGKAHPEGRALKGTLYTGTGDDNPASPQLFDYLLVFPNPASRDAHLRFVLNRASDVGLAVFDATGRRVLDRHRESLSPGEHDLTFDVEEWPSGIYLARMRIGNRTEVKELVVQ